MQAKNKQVISKEQIRRRREKLGLSKSKFAYESGLHPSTVSQIELGRLIPYPGQVEKIVTTLERLEAEGVK